MCKKELLSETLNLEEKAQNAANDFWNFGYADSGLSTSDIEFDKLDSNIVDAIFIAGYMKRQSDLESEQRASFLLSNCKKKNEI